MHIQSCCSSRAGLPDSKQLSTPMMLPVLRSRLPNLLAALGLPICRQQAASECRREQLHCNAFACCITYEVMQDTGVSKAYRSSTQQQALMGISYAHMLAIAHMRVWTRVQS